MLDVLSANTKTLFDRLITLISSFRRRGNDVAFSFGYYYTEDCRKA